MADKIRKRKTKRNAQIYLLRREGWCYRQLSEQFKISMTRVVQICKDLEAKEAAGTLPSFDGNVWNQLNMEKMDKMMAKEAAGDSIH